MLGDLTQTYTGSALTPTATTNPSGLAVTWTGAPQTNAGSYPVTATINDANYQGSATGTFTINKADATVMLGDLTQTYTGSALMPTATTNPSGLAVTWTGAPQTNAGSYPVTVTVNDANYQGSATGTFTINYGFKGLLQPYAAPPSDFKTGRSIPLKWQYTDFSGNVLNSSTSTPSITITLGGNSIPVGAPGKSGLQYNTITSTWQFNWQTKGLSAGTYQILITSAQTGQRNGPFAIQLR